jgi:hypothetical protein
MPAHGNRMAMLVLGLIPNILLALAVGSDLYGFLQGERGYVCDCCGWTRATEGRFLGWSAVELAAVSSAILFGLACRRWARSPAVMLMVPVCLVALQIWSL